MRCNYSSYSNFKGGVVKLALDFGYGSSNTSQNNHDVITFPCYDQLISVGERGPVKNYKSTMSSSHKTGTVNAHTPEHWTESLAYSFQSYMMTSSNGNIFRVTGPLWGEFTGHRWIPPTKASDAELWSFLWSAPEQTAEQTVETPVIWDTIALIMTSYNDINISL